MKLTDRFSLEWGWVPLRLIPTRGEVRFYGLLGRRFGIGVIRHVRYSNGEAVK